MKFENVKDLRKHAYELKNCEVITHVLMNKKAQYFLKNEQKVFNGNGATFAFYDEKGRLFILPRKTHLLSKFISILTNAGYKKAEIPVPLSNGFDYPEREKEWNEIKKIS